jgi:hypothetical protein
MYGAFGQVDFLGGIPHHNSWRIAFPALLDTFGIFIASSTTILIGCASAIL